MRVDPTSQPSLWLERNPGPERAPARDGQTADVIVVGGGMTGVAVALELQARGMQVLILEAGTLACAATARNVGFILEGVAESYVRTVALWGAQTARDARAFTVVNHDLIAALVEEHDIACGYARRGSIHLADTDVEERELVEGTAALLRDGFEAEYVPGDQLPDWARSAGYRCGQIIPRDGELDPVAFTLGLARVFEGRGGTICERSPASAVRADNDGARVTIPGGAVTGAAVVIAANAYSGDLVPWLASRIDPTRGQVLATAPIAERLFPRPIYASHGFEYWRQLDSGEVILGGWRNLDVASEVGLEHVLHDGIQGNMERFLRGIHPAIAAAPITARWSGIMGFSRDSLPIVGPVPGSPTLLVAAGFTGHGFGFAVHAARVLGELVATGESAEARLLDPRRLA